MHGTCRDLYRAPTTSRFQGYGPAIPRYIGATLYMIYSLLFGCNIFGVQSLNCVINCYNESCHKEVPAYLSTKYIYIPCKIAPKCVCFSHLSVYQEYPDKCFSWTRNYYRHLSKVLLMRTSNRFSRRNMKNIHNFWLRKALSRVTYTMYVTSL